MSQEGQPGEHYAIRDLIESERPRERLAQRGANALSTTELLAILLRTGIKGQNVLDMARRLLNDYRGLAGVAQASFGELAREFAYVRDSRLRVFWRQLRAVRSPAAAWRLGRRVMRSVARRLVGRVGGAAED